MTTLYKKSVDCAVCLTTQEITLVGSTNAFGSMDLDMRPPPMERNTLKYQIHWCEECGFCGPKLAWYEGLDVGLATGRDYLAVLLDNAYPDLARMFRAHGFLSSMAKNHVAAISAYMKAAWVCDNFPLRGKAAIACRKQALSLLSVLHESRNTYTSDLVTDQVLKIDLLRRTEQFDAAAEQISALGNGVLAEVLRQILNFQARLCSSKDVACYQVSDAMIEIDKT